MKTVTILAGFAVPLLVFLAAAANTQAAKKDASSDRGTATVSKSFRQGSLQKAVDAAYGTRYSGIKTLVISAGTLAAEDCRFIREDLGSLENLSIEGNAAFRNGVIPKNAFTGMESLSRVYIENATEVGAKAFSLCKNLEYVEMPDVTFLGVQAFAQAKGTGDSKLQTVKLPSLKAMDPRVFYYCTSLKDLYLTSPPEPCRPEGKEGLWFERATNLLIHVPDRATYDEFMKVGNCTAIDWSAHSFVADNGESLPQTEYSEEYDDSVYMHLRDGLLPNFDRTGKDFSGEYYNGDFKLSLNMYTFNMNINAWLNKTKNIPQLSTFDAIKWASEAGFDAVDITCYYIPGYSNTAMPTLSEKEVLGYAKKIKQLCDRLGIEISGTGLQNNFADPNEARRKTDVERIKFWIKVAHEMGAPVIRIFSGTPPADIRREGWEKIARERIVPHIQEVADYAAENYPDVRIGVQNHGDMLATANQVLLLLQWIDRDNVGIVNDTGFYREFMDTDATGYDWYGDMAAILPYSNNFQVKKKPAGAETSIPMDLVRVMTDIRKSPYRGYIPVELLWVSKDEGYPGNLSTPPYEETMAFAEKLRQAMEETKLWPDEAASPLLECDDKAGVLTILDRTRLCTLRDHVPGIRKAEDESGMPRTESEYLSEGDRISVLAEGVERIYTVKIKRYEIVNWALGASGSRIKASSYSKGSSPENAFDGVSTGTSGSGWTADRSQAVTAGKETFWLSADLGEVRELNSIGVAWGTAVGRLKQYLVDGTYSVYCTDDPKLWSRLHGASSCGQSGLDGYLVPTGWTLLYSQNVNELPDANGNKLFIKDFKKPVKARYVMVSGTLKERSVEIYELMAFQKLLANGAAPETEYPEYDLAEIRPDCPGMYLKPGFPALVELGGPVPVWKLRAKADLSFEASLTGPSGAVIYTSGEKHVRAGEVFSLSTGVNCSEAGTYRMNFRIYGPDGKTVYETGCFTAVPAAASYDPDNACPAVYMEDDRLVYLPDYRGNVIIDYSSAGYAGGGVAIPNVPVKIVLEPSDDGNGDDTERIQKAVNTIARAPLDENGFRGALLLKAGTFRISRPVTVEADGIVIKGEGDGHGDIAFPSQPLAPDNWHDYTRSEAPEKGITKVVATWVSDSYNKNEALFDIRGSKPLETGKPVEIRDQYVPAGSHSLRLADVSAFKAGDRIAITRNVGPAWAHDLNMDEITDAPNMLSANQWVTDGKLESAYCDVVQERTVKSADAASGIIVLEEAIADPLDMKYGVSTVVLIDTSPRVKNCGVENMQLISNFGRKSTSQNTAFDVTYKYYDDEYHAQVGVRTMSAEDVWVRNVVTYHIDVAVNVSSGTMRATIQDIFCLEPVSGTGGERRYSFTNSGGSFVLNQRNYARYTRHGFIVMGNVMGPNVFLDDRSDWEFDANEPHLRWSAGGLFDNVKGRIYVQNRWSNGTAHGWAGANYTLYNCDGKFIVSQSQLAPNYLIGQGNASDRLQFVMDATDPGRVPNFKAYEYSVGKHVEPRSLYLQQLQDRLGTAAVENALRNTVPDPVDESDGFMDSFAFLDGIFVDGKALEGFDRETMQYELPVALDWTSLPELTAVGEPGTELSVSRNGDGAEFIVSADGRLCSMYKVHYGFVSKEPVSSDAGNSQLGNLTDGDVTTSWSRSGSPYVQFYLGDTPVTVKSVALGYCRNTQSRRQYYFDFYVSNDGYTWTKVSRDNWQQDNLGNGHVMGQLVSPGVGNSETDYEKFEFPAGVEARLLRVCMYGSRMGQGSSSTSANAYWCIDVETE